MKIKVLRKIDYGAMMLEVTEKDKEALKELCKRGNFEMPEIKMSVYKNRAGRWKGIIVWCKANRGICRIDPLFVTKYDYELVPMDDFKINVKRSVDLSAF